MLTHVVMFRFNDPVDSVEAITRLRALAGEVLAARTLRVGTNTNAATGAFEIILISEHTDAAALDEYRNHPHHQAVLDWLAEHPHERVAFDTTDLA